ISASQIIEEIKRLDPKEQLGVIRFAYQLLGLTHLCRSHPCGSIRHSKELRASLAANVKCFRACCPNRPDWKEKSTRAGGDVVTECSHHDGTTQERSAAL